MKKYKNEHLYYIYVLYMYIIYVYYMYIICILYVYLATDLGRYIRESAVRTPPGGFTDWLTFFMVVTLFFFIFFTDFYWLIDFLLTDWLFGPNKKATSWDGLAGTATEVHNDHFWLTYWHLGWLTDIWAKQIGYVGKRTCQNRRRGTQR